jgi:RNA polymerase primary sigma factor
MATSLQRDKRIGPTHEARMTGKSEQMLRPDQPSNKANQENPDGDRNLTIDVTSLHFLDICSLPLLTHQEEIALAKRIELGQQAQDVLITSKCPELRVHLEQTILDGLSAKTELWEGNCRLVASVARRYIGKGVPFDDLIQEGNLGLEHAIVKFDWRKGFKYSTYAYWWIRQSVSRAVSHQSRTIRIPFHKIEFITRVFRASEELQQINGSEANIKQISEYMQAPVELVEESFRAYRFTKSLDDTAGTYDDRDTYNDVPDPGLTEDIGEKIYLKHEVRSKLLNDLTDRERSILELRYGIVDGEEHTLAYVGTEFGISRERVRQIEAEALVKPRSTVRKDWFADYL